MNFSAARLAPRTLLGALSLLLSACAGVAPPAAAPGIAAVAPQEPPVALVNSLTWTNPLSGQRDGARSSWPLSGRDGYDEAFPLAQLKHCGADGACAWGVMRAARSIAHVRPGPDGVLLDLTLELHVDRRQQVHQGTFNAAMAIPSDVPALQVNRVEQRSLSLRYGKVEHLELDYGVQFDVCVQRYDAAGKAQDVCPIPYI